jgi:phosphoglycolate phosphatase
MLGVVSGAIRFAVFDLDGTLVDSLRDLADAANGLAAAYGRPPLADAAVAGMIGDGAGVLVQRVCAAAGLDATPPDAVTRFLAIYDRLMLVHTRPYPGVPAMLAALAGRVPLAVLTNKPHEPMRRMLDAFDLSPHFVACLGSDAGFPRKPDPTALRHLMAQADATPDATLLVGDSAIDLDTARRGGVRLCLARWGFGYRPEFEPLPPGDLAIDSPAELVGLI